MITGVIFKRVLATFCFVSSLVLSRKQRGTISGTRYQVILDKDFSTEEEMLEFVVEFFFAIIVYFLCEIRDDTRGAS